MEMDTYQGVCRYCGDVQPIMAADQLDADMKISEECPCGGAGREKRHKAMLSNIEKLTGSGAGERGFIELKNAERELINTVADAVFDEVAGKVTIVLSDSTITIKYTGDKIKIDRKRVIGAGMEA